jgi:acyl-coenzyme A thioesterase PaaI-like protein
MYLAGSINEFYRPRIVVAHRRAEIEIDVTEALFHAGHAVHGSVYFKMLDDAAWFAVNSVLEDCFVLTKTFTVELLRPIRAGTIRSEGKIVSGEDREFVATSVAFDGEGREVGRGQGVFVKGRGRLADAAGYGTVA